jgi:class 3 adenylate cyclase
LRIGINSGPIVAGIIGTNKFAYDLWGDVVNTASRMESEGVPECIQVTAPTYDLIKHRFVCEPRGITVREREMDMLPRLCFALVDRRQLLATPRPTPAR